MCIIVPLKHDTYQNKLAHDNLLEFLQIGNLGWADLSLEASAGSRYLVVTGPNFSGYDGKERFPISLCRQLCCSVIAMLERVCQQGLFDLPDDRLAHPFSLH